MRRVRGFFGTVQMAGLAAVVAAVGGAYVKGRLDGARPWKEATAVVEAQQEALRQQLEVADGRRKEMEHVIEERDRELARLERTQRGMRDSLAAFATERGACRTRLAALGALAAEGARLVEEGQRLARTIATEHDRCRADIAALAPLVGTDQHHD